MRQAKPGRGGQQDSELETFHRDPAGPSPARQSRPAAGTECCGCQEVRITERSIRSVHREQTGREIQPRNPICRGSRRGNGARKAARPRRRAWRERPTGVRDRGMSAWGSSRNLGGPAVSSVGGTKRRGNTASLEGRQGVRAPAQYQRSRGTAPRDPVEGRRVSEHGTNGGKGGWELRGPATSQRNSSG